MSLFSGIFYKKQHIICIEVLPESIKAAHVELNQKEEELKILKFNEVHTDTLSIPIEKLCSQINSIAAKFKLSKNQSIILGLHDRAAVTTRLSSSVTRLNNTGILNEPELEDLLFKAQWRIFDKTRSAISSKMGIHDLDLHLVDAKVEKIRLDGHKVINPLGFRPRLIELDIANTFVSKKLVASLKSLLKDKQKLELIIENDIALVNTILRIFKHDSGIIINIGRSQTNIMIINEGNLVYNQQFSWGEDSLTHAVAKFFGVKKSMAVQILEFYIDGGLSTYVQKKITKLLIEELRWFFEGVGIALNTMRIKLSIPQSIFINQQATLPPLVISKIKNYKWPRSYFKTKPKTFIIHDTFLSEEMHLNRGIDNSFVALLFEFLYGEKGEKQLNNLLHKRIRWLEV